MSSPLRPPVKEVDVGFLVFVERYATDLLKWDILTFFAHNPDYRASVEEIAQVLGRSTLVMQSEIGDLALLGILEKQETAGDVIVYQLTHETHLRRMMLKFANQLAPSTLR